jgi:hypothetical protein
MKKVLCLLAVVAVAAVSLPALAAGPSDPTPGPTSTGRMPVGIGFAGTEETTISGLVVDGDGTPLKDVTVKLYIGGLLIAESVTGTGGDFEIIELINYGDDVTVDLWFLPSTPELVMENVLLKESSSAIEHGLYSRCVSRVKLDPIVDVIVRIVDLEARNERLEEQGCVG